MAIQKINNILRVLICIYFSFDIFSHNYPYIMYLNEADLLLSAKHML